VLQTNEDIEDLVATLGGTGHFSRRSTAEFMVCGIQPAQRLICFAKYLYGSNEQRVGYPGSRSFNLIEVQADNHRDSPAVGKLNRPVEVSIRRHGYLNANANWDRAGRPGKLT
jgi:hypothetical protein